MKKLIVSVALLLLASSNAFAADGSAPKDDAAMMKHCQSMMKNGKMMDGMPKQMTDKCKTMMKDDNMQGMKMDTAPSDTDKPSDSDVSTDHKQHHPDAAQ